MNKFKEFLKRQHRDTNYAGWFGAAAVMILAAAYRYGQLPEIATAIGILAGCYLAYKAVVLLLHSTGDRKRKLVRALKYVVVLIVLLLPVYWYAIRPGQIKKECFEITVAQYPDVRQYGMYNKVHEAFYQSCLIQHGL